MNRFLMFKHFAANNESGIAETTNIVFVVLRHVILNIGEGSYICCTNPTQEIPTIKLEWNHLIFYLLMNQFIMISLQMIH